MRGFTAFAGLFAGPTSPISPHGKLPRISVLPARRSIASLFLILALVACLPARPQTPREVVVRGYTFKHQQASEAVSLVYPLLSPRGTVEFQPASNTLVIRDTQAAINRILPVLRKFDHPAMPLRLEVIVVRASRAPMVSPRVSYSDLPDRLTQQLRDLLGYDTFEVQARAQLAGAEGQQVVYEVGPEYKVSFRFGTLLPDQRIKLSGFRISRRAEGRPERELLQSTPTLVLDRPFNLGLAKSEASPEALMLVLTLRRGP